MKKYKPRTRRVDKYVPMIAEVFVSCAQGNPIDMNALASKHRMARGAGYALIHIGVIQNRKINGMAVKNTYDWVNPNKWDYRHIAEKSLTYVYEARMGSKEKSVSVSKNVSTEKQTKTVILPERSNTRAVRLKIFGITIFEYEKRGK
jgi:hypothetical protein